MIALVRDVGTATIGVSAKSPTGRRFAGRGTSRRVPAIKELSSLVDLQQQR